eukprot:CAMPEP_0172182600 /NCGR_PEP_ID=MMETSP1050-20130122/18491_1 /TAXON_ID=233186 /ORGANISM="Cryptomonas curvata, Strain CCAP979/52" /LENGTH=174 /DNA_ID=CAMNT_0012856067 /DNA_START=477 /DNA_END=998 /DNA_ORIENTATION=+
MLSEDICEALRLHSEALKLETGGLDTTAATARGSAFRRRSSSLCLSSPCFMLEPCIELSSQDDNTTASSTSTGGSDCPRDRERVASPPRAKPPPSSIRTMRRHSITTAAIGLEHIRGQTLELIVEQQSAGGRASPKAWTKAWTTMPTRSRRGSVGSGGSVASSAASCLGLEYSA